MKRSKRRVTTLLAAAIAGAALLCFAGCNEKPNDTIDWVNPYKVYGGYTKLEPRQNYGEGTFVDVFYSAYYYCAFGFLQDEYALDEAEMTYYFALDDVAFRDLYNSSGFASGGERFISCNTYCYAYRESRKEELKASSINLDDFFADAELNRAQDGVILFNKIAIDDFGQFPFNDYRIETDYDKGEGFGLIEDGRQIGYAFSQQVKIPREMFTGEKGEIYFSAQGRLVRESSFYEGEKIDCLSPERSLARIFYKVEGDRVRIATTNAFYWE